MFYSQEVTKIVQVLKSGGIVVHPTDTVWGVAAAAFDQKAVQGIFELKKRPADKKLILLVDHPSKIGQYVHNIPIKANSILDFHARPITIIYEKAKNLPPYLIAEDGSIAIRATKDPFCQAIIKELGAPIVSSSANFSNEPTPLNFTDINPAFADAVNYVSHHRRNEKIEALPSTIARISKSNELIILRK